MLDDAQNKLRVLGHLRIREIHFPVKATRLGQVDVRCNALLNRAVAERRNPQVAVVWSVTASLPSFPLDGYRIPDRPFLAQILRISIRHHVLGPRRRDRAQSR